MTYDKAADKNGMNQAPVPPAQSPEAGEARASAGPPPPEALPTASRQDAAKAAPAAHIPIPAVEQKVTPGKALILRLSKDKMEAYVICDARVDVSDPKAAFQDMMAFLASQSIVGIKEDTLRDLIASVPNSASLLIAEGKPAIDGENGEVIFQIERGDNPDERAKSLKRVDFHAMHHIDNVEEGTVLARLKPSTPGEPGHDVQGRSLKPKPGKPVRIVAGKNVAISIDGLEARATCKGVARASGGKLSVEPVFKVSGDVDYAVGNIDFVGNVDISGDVFPDFLVKADGSVTIQGNVDKANIEARVDVAIHGGLFGKPGVAVKAGHDVHINFAENAYVQAINDVVATDSLMQCEVRAGNVIHLTKPGVCFVGGRIVASGGIEAFTLGSPTSEVNTVAQIEIDPRLKRMRNLWLRELEEEEAKGASERDPKKIAALQAKISTAERQIERQRRAGVTVKESIYPGVELIIDDVRYMPSSELTHVRFVLASDERKILMLDI